MVTVQVVFTGMAPPVKVTEPDVLLTTPLHCGEFGTLATVSPAGKVSVNPTPVSGTVLAAGFFREKVKTEFPPAAIETGAKTLLIIGGAITVSVSQAAVVFLAFWSLVRAFTAIQF